MTASEDQPADAPIRGEIRSPGYRRVTHGVYRLLTPDGEDDDADAEFRRDLEGWRLVLPEGAVYTHLTGARLLGWQLPDIPEQVPVFAAVRSEDNRPRRPGLICSRLAREPEPRDCDGIPVDSPEEILLRCARDLGTLDLVILIDSARRLGHLDDERMTKLLASRRPGVRALRAACELSDPRAESGGETLLRVFHVACDVLVRPQAELFDADGRFLFRADLLVEGTNFVHEYDGGIHREKSQHRKDLRRERRFADSPYDRRGYSLDDLLNHPLTVMHELDRCLGRPHKNVRVDRWRRLVGNSMYSASGRERVMNRWRRITALVDWSRTA
jgi:hypothetical protein